MIPVRAAAWLAVMLTSLLILSGCAADGSPGSSSAELATMSDQTDDQKRARIRLQLAIGYYQQRQNKVALDEIKQALAADPALAEAYSMRALIYMDMGENQLAEENFLKALQLSPNSPDFNNNYGWFLCQNGKERESIRYFDSALKSRAYQSPAKALSNAGECSLRFNDKVAAERYLSQAFQLEPGNPSTNSRLAKIYFEQGHFERAKFYVGLVMKSDILTADVLWLAIKIEHKLGNQNAENSLATQLRRRHAGSAEYAAYQRGAFNE